MSERRSWWIFSWGEPLLKEQPDAFRYYGMYWRGWVIGYWRCQKPIGTYRVGVEVSRE